MRFMRMLPLIVAMSALSLGASPGQAQTVTCATIYFGSGCNPVVSDAEQNTAMGSDALNPNTTGFNNTAVGDNSLVSNTNGNNNTASGTDTLTLNTTGNYNTAYGAGALYANTAGINNTAAGAGALTVNSTGNYNTASGYGALYNNTIGYGNTAVGVAALDLNRTGNYSTALGYHALVNSESGLGNIAVGPLAGQNITQGQLNIDIGSWGSADESQTIRIGLPQYHLRTYIAGITTTQVTGAQVVVTPSGQLGVLASSERYKTDIAPLASTTNKLLQLRPVRFHLKSDPNGAVQYGLIAEEVDKVYPELVIRDEAGKIQGVRYDELAPMLLNEMQKDHDAIVTLAAQHEADSAKLASMERQLAEVHAALVSLQSGDERVARR